MIARVWRGLTLNSKAEEYYEYLLNTGVKGIESIYGNEGVYLFRRNSEAHTEFLLTYPYGNLLRVYANSQDLTSKRPSIIQRTEIFYSNLNP
jgi:hypothetical protein